MRRHKRPSWVGYRCHSCGCWIERGGLCAMCMRESLTHWDGFAHRETALLAAAPCDLALGWWLLLGLPTGDIVGRLMPVECPRPRLGRLFTGTVDWVRWGRQITIPVETRAQPVWLARDAGQDLSRVDYTTRTLDLQRYGLILDDLRVGQVIAAFDQPTMRWFVREAVIRPRATIVHSSMAD